MAWHITLISDERRDVLNQRQLYCFNNSSFRLKPKKLGIIALLWGKSIGGQWIPLTKGQ